MALKLLAPSNKKFLSYFFRLLERKIGRRTGKGGEIDCRLLARAYAESPQNLGRKARNRV